MSMSSSQKSLSNRSFTAKWHESMETIDREQWNRLAIPMKNPFLEWEWLFMLERSKSICPDRGWYPKHLTLYENNRMLAAAPLYIKMNSEGEYIYDLDWFNIASRMDIAYYPKMVGTIPLTPVPGYRFLVDSQEDERWIARILVKLINQYCKAQKINSCNFLYIDDDWIPIMNQLRFVEWKHYTYQWHNRNYIDYDHFLQTLKTSHRKNIKRERNALEKQNIQLNVHIGDNIPKSFYSHMRNFYIHTGNKYDSESEPYFTPHFFDQLSAYYDHRSMFITAHSAMRPEKPLAMAYFVYKGQRLSGRYWGTELDIPFLHFNVCYYRAIQWAIENNIQVVDPGAGGVHKLKRGFPATLFHSLHLFYDWRFQLLMMQHIDQINELEQKEVNLLNENLKKK